MIKSIIGFFTGGSIMTYVYLAVALAFGILVWRNWEVGRERDAALMTVGAQKVQIAQMQANIDYAKETVVRWQTAQQLFEHAVQEQNHVTYLSSLEGRKVHVAFQNHDWDAVALADPSGLARRRNAGWDRLNCLWVASDVRSCPVGPSTAGEAEPATAVSP